MLNITPIFSCVDKSLVVNIHFNKSVWLCNHIIKLSFTHFKNPFIFQKSFEISDGIDGSAFSYTVIYSDSISGILCSSETIPSSACVEGICIHSSTVDYHSVSGCFTSDTVSVTVLATNVLGNGSLSDPIVFIIPKCDGCK